MCTLDLTAWSSDGLFLKNRTLPTQSQKSIGKLANNLSRKCQLSAKIELVTVRRARRLVLHPVDTWIIRLQLASVKKSVRRAK